MPYSVSLGLKRLQRFDFMILLCHYLYEMGYFLCRKGSVPGLLHNMIMTPNKQEYLSLKSLSIGRQKTLYHRHWSVDLAQYGILRTKVCDF